MTRTRELEKLHPMPVPDRSLTERARGLYGVARRELFYGTLLYPYGVRKLRVNAAEGDRSGSHIYTKFYRVPGQLDALIGPVMDFLGVDGQGQRSEKLHINIFAGSVGAEAYTLASVLRTALPSLDFEIECSDLHDETVERSIEGVYTRRELGPEAPPDFIKNTFDLQGDLYRVKDELRPYVRFFPADIIEDDLAAAYSPGDLLLVQNVFCHLPDPATEKALANVLKTGKQRFAIGLDGMSLDGRVALTKEHGLEPLDYKLKEIHDQARMHLPLAWWNRYYGTEPYKMFKKDRIRRFSTIFFRGGEHTT